MATDALVAKGALVAILALAASGLKNSGRRLAEEAGGGAGGSPERNNSNNPRAK